jgi:hypothetical protein
MRLTLATGDRIDVDLAVDSALKGSDPDVGDLLFYGTHPELWFYAQRPGSDPNCYLIQALVAEETNSELWFDFGLILPKAQDFDRGSGNFRDPLTAFCVNDRGEVTRLRE